MEVRKSGTLRRRWLSVLLVTLATLHRLRGLDGVSDISIHSRHPIVLQRGGASAGDLSLRLHRTTDVLVRTGRDFAIDPGPRDRPVGSELDGG